MPYCPICGESMTEILSCLKAEDCYFDEECYERDCFEPVNAGWECRTCSLEV